MRVTGAPRFVVLMLAGAATVSCIAAADWRSERGDAARSGWQRHERQLSAATVGQMKLLWKRTLDNHASGLDSLTTPVMLGPIFTHRGIKELVFVAGTADNVFAVDADLGRIFWTRHLESHVERSAGACDAGVMAAPVISPPPAASTSPDDETEPRTPLRPIYVAASDGYLHKIRPSTGQDMAPAWKLLAPGMKVKSLDLVGGSVYATASAACGGGTEEVRSIVVDGTGEVSERRDSAAPLPGIVQRDAGRYTGFATATSADGHRWVYVSRRGPHAGVAGFQIGGSDDRPRLNAVWTSHEIAGALAPVTANGIVYVLASGEFAGTARDDGERIAKSTHAVLFALDAATGKELYSSGDAITSFVHSSGLAIANGHVCFGTGDSTLYCFGLPLEIF